MPTFTISVTLSTRVANLVSESSIRHQAALDTPLTPRDWFAQRVREAAVGYAVDEKVQQDMDAAQGDTAAIDSEVTT